MYSEQDIISANRKMKTLVLWYILASAGFIALLWLGYYLRSAYIVYPVGVVYAAFSVFYFGMFIHRLYKWREYLIDMRDGLEKSAEGHITHIDTSPSVRDGMEFVRILFCDDEGEGQDRVLYFDASKLPIPVQQGEHIRLRLFGIYIKDISSAEAKE